MVIGIHFVLIKRIAEVKPTVFDTCMDVNLLINRNVAILRHSREKIRIFCSQIVELLNK